MTWGCTFRRTVGSELMQRWEEVIQLASILNLSEINDEMLWTFNSNGVYSSQSLYKVINFGGVKSMFIPPICSLRIPLEYTSFTGYSLRTRWLANGLAGSTSKALKDRGVLFKRYCSAWTVPWPMLVRLLVLPGLDQVVSLLGLSVSLGGYKYLVASSVVIKQEYRP